MRIPRELRNIIRERAGQRCEYCHLPDNRSRFHVEHMIAIQHDGTTELDNLAWACLQCNVLKGPNIASIDREAGLTPLYDPRKQVWTEHFEVVDGEIIGRTAIGRVTSRLLGFNATNRLKMRRALVMLGEWSPD